jgi:hypothetical protein
MPEQLFRVDPQKSERQQDHNRFAQIRLAGSGQRRNRKSDENRCGGHQRAVPPDERKRDRKGAKQFH